jgi:hypothetical protein
MSSAKRKKDCFHLPHEATFPKGGAASFVATLAANVRRGFHGIDTILVAGSPTYIVEKDKQFGTETSIESAYAKCDNQEDLGNLIETAILAQRKEVVDTESIKGALRSTKEVFKSGLLNTDRDPDELNPGARCLEALRDGTEGAKKTLIFGNRFKKVAKKDKPTDDITVHGKPLKSTTAKPYYVTDGEVLEQYYPGESIKTLSSGACDKVINKGKELPTGPKYKVTWGSTLAKRKANIKKLEEKLGSGSGISFGAVTPEDECDATFASACRVLDAYAVSLAIEGRSLPVKIGLFSVGGSCVHVAVYERVGEHNYNRIDMPVIEEVIEERAAGDGSPLAQRQKFNATAPFTEQTLHHATQTKMYALMGSFADERKISNQHELVTAFHDFVTSGKFETSGWKHTPYEPSVFVDKGYKIGDIVTLKDLKNTKMMPTLDKFNGRICQVVPMQPSHKPRPNGIAYYTVPEGTRIGDGEWNQVAYDSKGWYHLLLDGGNTVFNLPDKYFKPYDPLTDGSRHGPAYLWGKHGVQPPAYTTSRKMPGVPSRGGKKVAL